MKKAERIKSNFKRIISGMLVISIVLTQMIFTEKVVYASDGYNSESVVIQANKISKQGNYICINGEEEIVERVIDLRGIKRFLNSKTLKYDILYYGNDEYDNSASIYSSSSIELNSGSIKLSDVIVAEGDVVTNSTVLTSSDTIIYSENGDISISASEINYEGIIYAPNGRVTINASSVNFVGKIIAKEVNISVGIFIGYGMKEYDREVKILNNISVDAIFDFFIYEANDKYYVRYTCVEEFNSIDIYIRYNDEKEFVYYKKMEEGNVFEFPKVFEYIDIVLIGKTIFGNKIESNIITYIDNAGIKEVASRDSDGDGIEDGVELRITKTNPYEKDSDKDGINDYIESFYLYTDANADSTSIDHDKDGISDFKEMEIGTNPFLKDSDFDGINDREDSLPLYFNGEGIANDIEIESIIGPYDKVITSISENGDFYKCIYDPINKITKSIQYNEQIIICYYDINKRPCIYLSNNNDFSRVNCYQYDDNGNIIYLFNNGEIYKYKYSEDDLVQVTINDKVIYSIEKNDEYGNSSIIYGNGDFIGLKKDTVKNEYTVDYNGECSSKYMTDENGQILYYCDHKNQIEYYNVYDENGYLAETVSNQGITFLYDYNDEYYEVKYVSADEVKKERIYYNNDNNKDIFVELISEDRLLVKYNEGIVKYDIIKEKGDYVISALYSYDDNDNIKKIEFLNGDTYEYTYINEEKVSKVYINGVLNNEYEYTINGQLKKEKDYINNIIKCYYYDSYNNIEKVERYQINDDKSIILVDTIVYDYESDLWNDVLSSYNGIKIQYDLIGNPIEYYNGMNMFWTGKSLDRIEKSDLTVDYYYNISGIRTEKNVNGKRTKYILEGNDIIAEVSDEYTIWYIYNEATDVIGFIYNGEKYYYHKNSTKDIIGIVDESGSNVVTYTYDAWGNITNKSGNVVLADINPYRYKSYYYDNETGLYYLKYRYYDSKTGRFINTDNLEYTVNNKTDYNLYAYCCNDPVNNFDPDGKASLRVRIFTISEFYEETRDYLKDDLYDTGHIVYTQICISDSRNKFIEWWNSLNGYDIAIINTHGVPRMLGTKGMSESLIRSDLVNTRLNYINVKVVVILGCNCGHFSINDNIALVLSKRVVGGIVLASDGTVLTDKSNGFLGLENSVKYTSTADDTFVQWATNGGNTRKTNYGWMIYSKTSSIVYYLSNKSLKMDYVVNLVTSNNYKAYK